MAEPGGTDDMAGRMPIGNQDFKDIREKEYLHIDKTDTILRRRPCEGILT
jgi:hypothetical protein